MAGLGCMQLPAVLCLQSTALGLLWKTACFTSCTRHEPHKHNRNGHRHSIPSSSFAFLQNAVVLDAPSALVMGYLHAVLCCADRDLSNNKQLCGSLPQIKSSSPAVTIRAEGTSLGQPCTTRASAPAPAGGSTAAGDEPAAGGTSMSSKSRSCLLRASVQKNDWRL